MSNITSNPTISPTIFQNVTSSPTASPTVPSISGIEEFVQSDTALLIALIAAFAAIFISGTNIFKHLIYYTEPALQKNIVRILFMVPFYALFSFLSLSIKEGHIVFDSIRDIYEAFVVYCFLNLMLMYCGGENACLSVIMNNPGTISHVFPLNCCFPDEALTSRFLRRCKQGTLQFVIIKPIMAILTLVLYAAGKEDNRAWEITQSVIYNISYTLALYMLVLFYKATHEHPGLKGQYPIMKFLSVKLVVFATYYQTVLVSIAPGVKEENKEALNNFILCCEMVLFACMQYIAFRWREFDGNKFSENGNNDGNNNQNDNTFDSIGIEAQEYPSPTSPGDNGTALNNAKDVISIKDVATDAYYNFNNKYGNHVLLDANETDMASQTSSPIGSKNSNSMSANPFGGIATTARSLRKGVSLNTDDDDNHNFVPSTMNNANDGDSQQDTGKVNPFFDEQPTFDPNIPSYIAEKDNDFVDNPFAQDVNDPCNIQEDLTETTSPSFANNNKSKAASDWTADFTETSNSTEKKKKKKKKKKAAQPNAQDLSLV